MAPLLYQLAVLAPLVLWHAVGAPVPARPMPWDVVVLGSTPGGVMAAVAAARHNASVVIVSPSPHVGGMVSGGLGHTDTGNVSVIGGLALEFFTRVGKAYGAADAVFDFEPSVASEVFDAMLSDAHVPVMLSQELLNVTKTGSTVSVIAVNDTRTGTVSAFTANVFIDATYEGDLLAAAGVAFTVGREAAAAHNETTNGRTPIPNDFGGDNHQFHILVPYTAPATGAVLPGIYTGPVAAAGGADAKVQAYNFRLCLTQTTSNMLPMPRPSSYNATAWQLARNWFMGLNGSQASLNDFLIVSKLPNGKTDVNNHGPISTDFIGGSWQWPKGTAAARAAIFDRHKEYTLQLFHFLSTDDAVPASVRAAAQSYGLAKDEFQAWGGWPPQLYVREGRRMVSDFIFTQHNRVTNRTTRVSVGLGSYNIDNHHAERVLLPHDGGTWVLNEGNVEYGNEFGPFELPAAMMLPRRHEATNLVVPVAVSATHAGFGAIRLEPQWMILGQAAGTVAVLTPPGGAVQDVDAKALQAALVAAGARLHA